MLIQIHPENPNPREISKVIEALKKDGLIVYPTDTVYGLAWDINSPKAFDKIVRLKGKNALKENFSLICSSLSQVSEFTAHINNATFKILKHNLPGPFTFILTANNNVPRFYKEKKKTVGIRIPDNKIAVEIVEKLGNPIMTTSLHHDDEILDYMTDPELIHEKYEKLVDFVIDGGYGKNEASTVVNCTNDDFEIIRQGIGELVL
ncbi:MAG: threonylcarbamoyl-AMP synthase [Bacteroidetes bacterium GWC2_33_15]|nr:MAG: threonylcarbamoyl-AMP synthase [Bacteroidetes bacterium GWA2_33_15]OFX50370.1 MAG: threonylcarbamoyl-AMP synthase [Bacteroidetes bacterium GWC2_33_15]OFX66713.1 MAG: threonylcarbamoyl-AMP synthase [Bacteroidetes bacterium GWB2_32_14]OFX69331.1 MAG: threonylcarbamoyl-AMP synthase [Bacteroidetes bacterium GWD2_33_33]HAN18649.1 threonylcarbamoyl-AMP synthase [Bacteroidales bacterium]